MQELVESIDALDEQVDGFQAAIDAEQGPWQKQKKTAKALEEAVQRLAHLAEKSREPGETGRMVFKLAGRVIEVCETDLDARGSALWNTREIARARKAADAARQALVEQLKRARYFHKQAAWLTERFPEGELRDVEGLVKLVDRAELEANDWSLIPGRYVGVAPEEGRRRLRFRRGPARDPRRAGRPERRSRRPGRPDLPELQGAGDMKLSPPCGDK